MTETIMIVDDQPSTLRMTDYVVRHKLHYRTLPAGRMEALSLLRSARSPRVALILLDLAGGLEVLRVVRAMKLQLPVIALTHYGDREGAVKAVAAGANDYLYKPVELERLRLCLQQALTCQRMSNYIAWLERKMAGHMDLTDIVGQDTVLRQAIALASDAAASRVPVLICGEPGTGKEMFARAIHGSSDRAGKPFALMNCETTPSHLLDRLLFGQDNGGQGRLEFSLGKLREAEQGTLLLEEIQHLPTELQQRLVRLLKSATCGTRVIATSSAAMPENFDLHLYQYLQEFVITLPSLKNRRGDIPLLAEHFVTMYAVSENKYLKGVTDNALKWLSDNAWPGNVRQLANTLWRAVVLADGEVIDVSDLETAHKSRSSFTAYDGVASASLLDERGQVRTLKSVQEEAIRFALKAAGGCMTHAARSLGIGRSTLYRKVSELDLESYISRANQTTRPMMSVSSIERS